MHLISFSLLLILHPSWWVLDICGVTPSLDTGPRVTFHSASANILSIYYSGTSFEILISWRSLLCSYYVVSTGWTKKSVFSKKRKSAMLGHTMPGGTSTSRFLPMKGTYTRHVYSHSGVQKCWSRKLSKAKFGTISNIWGEIRKHIKSKFFALNVF